jgi:hypothetical protein
MKWVLTEHEALHAGFTHLGSYYGIPVYVGNLEFHEQEPITITTKYYLMDWLFTLFTFIEWLCTPPNRGIKLKIIGELGEQ